MILHRRGERAQRGSVLLIVLWMLIVLGVIGLSYSFSVRTQLQITQRARGKTEAYWAARAGVEQARALLAAIDLTMLIDTDPIFDEPEAFAEQRVGAAIFTIMAPPIGFNEAARFGLIDEASLININTADEETLLELPGITEEMAQSLLDWRDSDDFPLPLGAEDDYYLSLEDPYPARNGPLASVRELMRLRGWAPVFEGALQDPYTKFLPLNQRPESMYPEDARALLSQLTAWSEQESLAPDGREKINLTQAGVREMRRRLGSLTNQEAQAITNHRSSGQFSSAVDLLDVAVPTNQNSQGSGQNSGSGTGGSSSGRRGAFQITVIQTQTQTQSSSGGQSSAQGSGASAPAGPRMFNLRRVGEIIDFFTHDGDQESQSGLININTASFDVLRTLPEMTDELASALVEERHQGGAFDRAGWIVNLPGMTEQAFRAIYPKITTTSSRFRVISRGVGPSTRATVTIEAVLAVEQGEVEIVYWREM